MVTSCHVGAGYASVYHKQRGSVNSYNYGTKIKP